MARGKKTGGKTLQKGQTYARRPPMDKDVKSIRSFEINEFYRLANECLDLSMKNFKDEIKKENEKGDISMRKAIILKVLSLAVTGNIKAVEELWNRLLGKPHQTMELKKKDEFAPKLIKFVHEIVDQEDVKQNRIIEKIEEKK